jgi:methyl-accepting chemotaxis protein
MAGKMIAALQVGLGLESAEFKKNADEAKRKAQDLGNSFKDVERQTRSYDQAIKDVGTSKKQFAQQAQNVGYQVQDFAVQVGSGTSVMQALGQQLPQLLSSFGMLGIVLGTLAAVAIPVIKASLQSLGFEMRNLEQILKDVDAAGQSFTDMNDKAGMSLKDLSEIYNQEAGPALLKLYDQMRGLSGMKFGDEIKASAKALGDEYNKFFFGLIPKTAGWAASSLAKDLNVAEDEAGRLLNTLKGLESGTANIQSVRNYVTGLQLDLSKASDEGRKWYTQFLSFYTKATESTEKLTTAQSKAISEGRRAIESAAKSAQSYLEELDKQIRRITEGEAISSLSEARKAAGEAGVRKMTILVQLKFDKDELQTFNHVMDQLSKETDKAMGEDRKNLVKEFTDEIARLPSEIALD